MLGCPYYIFLEVFVRSFSYLSDPQPRGLSLWRAACRRGAVDLYASARGTLLLLVCCWLPLIAPLAAGRLASVPALVAGGALGVLGLFAFAALLRSRSRTPVSTGLVVVVGLALVCLVTLEVVEAPDQRLWFLMGALLGGLLAAAVNFVLYTFSQVRREALMYRSDL